MCIKKIENKKEKTGKMSTYPIYLRLFFFLLVFSWTSRTSSFHPGTPLLCRRPAVMYIRDIEICLASSFSTSSLLICLADAWPHRPISSSFFFLFGRMNWPQRCTHVTLFFLLFLTVLVRDSRDSKNQSSGGTTATEGFTGLATEITPSPSAFHRQRF